MSEPIDTGGAAFRVSPEESRGKVASVRGGLTIRDWLAGQAMAGLLSAAHQEKLIEAGAEDYSRAIRDTAKESYQFADAMLAARKQP